jgi:transcription termination factor Rho
MTPKDGITMLLEKLRKTKSNPEFLMAVRNSGAGL